MTDADIHREAVRRTAEYYSLRSREVRDILAKPTSPADWHDMEVRATFKSELDRCSPKDW